MNENILYNFLKDKPHFLNYDDELKLVDIMTKLPMSWLIENEDEFIYDLRQLADSHTLGGGFLYEFYYQERGDDIIFDNLCEWLREVYNKTGIPTFLYISHFNSKRLDELRQGSEKDENTDK